MATSTREAQQELQKQTVEASLNAQAREGGTARQRAKGQAPVPTAPARGFYNADGEFVEYFCCGDPVGSTKPLAP